MSGQAKTKAIPEPAAGTRTLPGRRCILLALAAMFGATAAASARGGRTQADDCPPDSTDPDCKAK